MKHDIENRKDIELLVNSFYQKVKTDDTIGLIFTDIISVDWEHHLPKMYDFWEATLFATVGYKGHTVNRHIEINKSIKLEDKHFDRWRDLFFETVDENFEGKISELAKTRVTNMIFLIKMKIEDSYKANFIQ
jgi:hemoglobin